MPIPPRKVTYAVLLLPLALLLGGCGNGGLAGALRSSGVTSTPDEFLVLPTRPLEMPDDLAALPTPTPGQRSRVEYEPEAIAVAGLTGRESTARTANGTALLARAGVASNTPQIRQILAEEDVVYQQNHKGRLLEWVFSPDKESLVYRDMILDPGAAYEAMRARGVKVPAAPPELLEGDN
ncbi:DUF3035 domain-containing protein [Amaricoccus macauensis]|uniref:DUF3035 domain-containing protein n=1 Tax=Amaricoccus macauensis TaxID=57001 RepID=UPI003C7C3746